MTNPALLVGVGSLAVLGLAYFAGHEIERRGFPIVADFITRDIVPQPDGTLNFRGSFTKLRACRPIDITWFIEDIDGLFAVAVPEVHAVDQLPRLANRPLGRQVSAWYNVPRAGVYFAILNYDCRLPWTTKAKWGPFHVQPWTNPQPVPGG